MKATARWILVPLLLAGIEAGANPAAQPAHTLSPATDCYYLPGPDVTDVYEFDPSPTVLDLVEKIAKTLTLDPHRFNVKAANVPNANAIIRDNERKVLYSTAFLNDLAGAPSGKWAITAVLAHEIAHHLNGDTLKIGPDRAGVELKADENSGMVVCELGGTLHQAQSALAGYGGQPHPAYPPLSARLAAVAKGWQDALDHNRCTDQSRNDEPDGWVTKAENIIVIRPENADSFQMRPSLMGAAIRFENVRLEVKRPMILFANKITFDNSSVLRGNDLKLIATEIEGGQIEAVGGAGENGGKILIAAGTVTGVTLNAHGSDGMGGDAGADGRNGRPGQNGTDGQCGPGILGQFVGSTAGSPGENGTDGQDGGTGGNGGNGGQIMLLTFQKNLLSLDVNPGEGGPGGPGGRGGHGGPGGRGGAGCQGLGGSQPTRPDGTDGATGRNGRSGAAGARGRQGRVWNVPIAGTYIIRDIHGDTGNNVTETAKRLEDLAIHKGENR